MKQKLKAIAFILGIGLLSGCVDGFAVKSQGGKISTGQDFSALVWNVQSLFDGDESGNEYAEFREASNWRPEKYQARITAISRVIGQLDAGIIGLVELENLQVLEDLGLALSGGGYKWKAFAALPGSSLGIGFLSRFPISGVKAHSITIGKESAPRPVLEVTIAPNDSPLVFFLCHFKSKLSGGAQGLDTETLRRASAAVIQRRLSELKESVEDAQVIVMGDLNENHDEFLRAGAFCALLPDDPDAAELAARAVKGTPGGPDFKGGFLVLSGEKPPAARCFPEETPALFSPWMENKNEPKSEHASEPINEGSYYYRGKWETIDHFLLSEALFDGCFWEYSGFTVLNREPFTTAKGTPNGYIAGKGTGLSDHLPLVLNLTFVQ